MYKDLSKEEAFMRLLNSKDVSLEEMQRLSKQENKTLSNLWQEVSGNGKVINLNPNLYFDIGTINSLGYTGLCKILEDKSLLDNIYWLNRFDNKDTAITYASQLRGCFDDLLCDIEQGLKEFKNSKDLMKSLKDLREFKSEEEHTRYILAHNILHKSSLVSLYINILCSYENIADNIDFIQKVLYKHKTIYRYTRALHMYSSFRISVDYPIKTEKCLRAYLNLLKSLYICKFNISLPFNTYNSQYIKEFSNLLLDCNDNDLLFDTLVMLSTIRLNQIGLSKCNYITVRDLFLTWCGLFYHKNNQYTTTDRLEIKNLDAREMYKFADIIRSHASKKDILVSVDSSFTDIYQINTLKKLIEDVYEKTGVAFVVTDSPSITNYEHVKLVNSPIVPIKLIDKLNDNSEIIKNMSYTFKVNLGKLTGKTLLSVDEVEDQQPVLDILRSLSKYNKLDLLSTTLLESLDCIPTLTNPSGDILPYTEEINTKVKLCLLSRYKRIYYLTKDKVLKEDCSVKIREILEYIDSKRTYAKSACYTENNILNFKHSQEIHLEKISAYTELNSLTGSMEKFNYNNLDRLEKEISVFDDRLRYLYINDLLTNPSTYLKALEVTYNKTYVEALNALRENKKNDNFSEDLYTKENLIDFLLNE